MRLGLVKTYTASGALAYGQVVKFSADNVVTATGAATDAMIGTVVSPSGAADGDRVDIQLSGLADGKAGGNITRGALVTSDAAGHVVAAAPAQGVDNRILGVAMLAAANNDIVEILLAPGSMQGQ